jgi:hypothetical protein
MVNKDFQLVIGKLPDKQLDTGELQLLSTSSTLSFSSIRLPPQQNALATASLAVSGETILLLISTKMVGHLLNPSSVKLLAL